MTERGSRVTDWLNDDDDNASVVSAFSRRADSEVGDFDEARYMVVDEVEQEQEVDGNVAAEVEAALQEVAEAAQRKAVCGFHRVYTRGRMLDTPDYNKRAFQPQRFFKLENFVTLSSLSDTTLIDALMVGPVRSRVGAETGMGKTRKLPGIIAQKCGLRVCQLELDNDVASDALKFQKKTYGIPGGARSWCREKKAYLTCMSYSEFRGVVLSGDRERLFQDFDVFYMDEAHEPKAAVWVAKQYFAAFAKPHNSLLVVSATVSTMETNNEVASGVGKFDIAAPAMSLEDAMNSGKMVTQYLKDRTLLLVASDEDAASARAYYAENGVDVFILDNASTISDRENVVRVLSVPTAVVPRVVVATENYGTGYNLPVSFVISTCTRRVFEMDSGNALVEREIPLMRKCVTQHQGRVGRGLANGAGGWLLTEETVPDGELLLSEALEAYMSLIAASITPRPGMFATVTKVLPKGIDAAVARMLLRSSLPIGLAVRYLGGDGRFAAKFVGAVQLFHQTGEKLRKSKDELPLGYELWTSEQVGEYYDGDETVTAVDLVVPFKCPRGLKIQMHAISAVADGLLHLEYWDSFDEEEESDDEIVGVRTKARKRVVVPRMPEAPASKVAATVASQAPIWQYGADPANAKVKRERRKGMSWDANGEGKTAVRTLLKSLDDERLGVSVAMPQFDLPEFHGKVVYALPIEEDEVEIPIKSAGGGRILSVSKDVHERFMNGEGLPSDAAVDLLQHLVTIRGLQRFAKSTVFDNWSSAWLCVFGMYENVGVFEAFKSKGLHSDAVKLLDYLYDRFRSEVLSVAVSSNYYRDKLRGFFSAKPSLSKFASAVRRGRLPIAQSDAFVSRVMDIKSAYDRSVMAIEGTGVYAPKLVTSAQQRLPIRERGRNLAVIDEDVVAGGKHTRVDSHNDVKWRD